MDRFDLSLKVLHRRVCIQLLILLTALSAGCNPTRLAFVSNSDGVDHIYSMTWMDWLGSPSPIVANITNHPLQTDRYPDISPDGTRIAYASERGGDHAIVVRNLNDATGASETVLVLGPDRKIRPRWSHNQDWIAYAEYSGGANQARIMAVNLSGGAPMAVTNPAPGESDSVGHDYFDNGNKIVFSRRNPSSNSYDLYFINSDGSGPVQPIVASQIVNEILPVISHDQSRLAFVSYIPLAAGWLEYVTVMDAATFATQHVFQFQPPVGGRRIGSLAFSHDDQKLYIATRVAEVSATENRNRYEIFAVNLDGSGAVRLTDNQWFDSDPSALPVTAAPSTPPCLVSWWPGDNNANDVAGTNHGTLYGGVSYVPGVLGSAFSFDGIDDYLLVAPNANLNITGDLTIVMWAKRSMFGTNLPGSSLIMQGNTSGPLGTPGAKGAYFLRFMAYSDQLEAGYYTPSGGSFGVGGPSISDTQFHHYAYVRSGGGVTVSHYLDGVFHNSHTFSDGPGDASGTPLVIGAFRSDLISTGIGLHFSGVIDEVAIFNCALSADQINTIYHNGIQALSGS